MKDVETAIVRTLDQLKDFARSNLNTLTLGYLGDVVDRKYQNLDLLPRDSVDDNTVESVLNRIHDSILNKKQKQHLFEVIRGVHLRVDRDDHDEIIYHYFIKLLDFQKSIQKREANITAFCELCSEYIVDKQFVYDSTSFDFSIVPSGGQADERVELSDLSSGEKQIVSLFGHLYLSGRHRYLLIIDEPELSLSVPWQRRFLRDIRSGDFCSGLIAATHSPFIYENELLPYTHALGEFVVRR